MANKDLPHHKKVHTLDAWRVLRITAEFVDGFETMVSLGPSVAVFGSSVHDPEDSTYYDLTIRIVEKICKKGFGVITGGGPGIMEAANKGAQKSGGKSCGLCINIPFEEKPNSYIDDNYRLLHRYFFVRKVMFVKYAQAFIVCPGGYGTLDEFFEALTLIKTKKIQPFPVFLVGREYWEGLIDWLKSNVLKRGMIEEKDLDLITITDDPDEIADLIEAHYHKTKTLENF